MTTKFRSRARSNAATVPTTASMAARCANATCNCCSPIRRPAHIRPISSAKARSTRLIRAKPQDRRAILEEASGTAGLHARRHEAELKLKGAEQNLLRVDDVLKAYDTQLRSLKQQMRQASRYRNLAEHIRRTEAALLHLRWHEAEQNAADPQSRHCRLPNSASTNCWRLSRKAPRNAHRNRRRTARPAPDRSGRRRHRAETDPDARADRSRNPPRRPPKCRRRNNAWRKPRRTANANKRAQGRRRSRHCQTARGRHAA